MRIIPSESTLIALLVCISGGRGGFIYKWRSDIIPRGYNKEIDGNWNMDLQYYERWYSKSRSIYS